MSFDQLQKTLEANNDNQEINIIKTEIISLKDQIERVLMNKIKDTKVDILKVSLSNDNEVEALTFKIKTLKDKISAIAEKNKYIDTVENSIVTFRGRLDSFEKELTSLNNVLNEATRSINQINAEHVKIYNKLKSIKEANENNIISLNDKIKANKLATNDKVEEEVKKLNDDLSKVRENYSKELEKIKLLIPDKYDDKGIRREVKNIDLKLRQVLTNLESQINQNFKLLSERIKAANSVIVTRGGGSGSGGGGGIDPATQAEVNAGVINTKAVTPLTLRNTTNVAKLLYVSKYGQEIDTTGDNPISYHLFELSSDANENKWIAKRVSHGANGATSVTYGTNLNNTTITSKANAFDGIKDLTFVSSLNTAGVST